MVLAPGDGTPLPVDGGAGPDESTDDRGGAVRPAARSAGLLARRHGPPDRRRRPGPGRHPRLRRRPGDGEGRRGGPRRGLQPPARRARVARAQPGPAGDGARPRRARSWSSSLRRRWRVALLLLLAGGLANVLMVVADALVIDRRLVDALDQIRDQHATCSAALVAPARPCWPRPRRSSPWPRRGCRGDGGGRCGGAWPSSPSCGSSPWPRPRST